MDNQSVVMNYIFVCYNWPWLQSSSTKKEAKQLFGLNILHILPLIRDEFSSRFQFVLKFPYLLSRWRVPKYKAKLF